MCVQYWCRQIQPCPSHPRPAITLFVNRIAQIGKLQRTRQSSHRGFAILPSSIMNEDFRACLKPRLV